MNANFYDVQSYRIIVRTTPSSGDELVFFMYDLEYYLKLYLDGIWQFSGTCFIM